MHEFPFVHKIHKFDHGDDLVIMAMTGCWSCMKISFKAVFMTPRSSPSTWPSSPSSTCPWSSSSPPPWSKLPASNYSLQCPKLWESVHSSSKSTASSTASTELPEYRQIFKESSRQHPHPNCQDPVYKQILRQNILLYRSYSSAILPMPSYIIALPFPVWRCDWRL